MAQIILDLDDYQDILDRIEALENKANEQDAYKDINEEESDDEEII